MSPTAVCAWRNQMSSELPISPDFPFFFGKKYWLVLIHGNQNPLLESRFCILGISSRSGSRAAGNSPNALCCVPRSACCTRAVPALLLHSSAGAGTAVQLSSTLIGSVRRRAVLGSQIALLHKQPRAKCCRSRCAEPLLGECRNCAAISKRSRGAQISLG